MYLRLSKIIIKYFLLKQEIKILNFKIFKNYLKTQTKDQK